MKAEMGQMERRDKIRGCLIGGAAGDALGYAVEFQGERMIFRRYGEQGIQAYELDGRKGEALISDDTQMTLFTANGLLAWETRRKLQGTGEAPSAYVSRAYQDWLRTQEMAYEKGRTVPGDPECPSVSWLRDVPQLYSLRAPGNTCLSALSARRRDQLYVGDYLRMPLNSSKGCGGVMRAAPMGLLAWTDDIRAVDLEGARAAAVTHGHALGYLPAAMLAHIVNRLVFPQAPMTLKEIVLEADRTVAELFAGDASVGSFHDLVCLAVDLAENGDPDLENIHRLGEGWVGDEALAIALYCSLRYQDDFSAGLIASVNHKGDSDSTGAVTGNILGALEGYDAMEEKWKQNLELSEVILEMADDLSLGCPLSKEDPRRAAWERKYLLARWKEER